MRVTHFGSNFIIKTLCVVGTFLIAAHSQAQFGTSLYFEDVDEHIQIPDHDSLDFRNELSIECWVKICDITSNHIMVGKEMCLTNNFSYYFSVHLGKLQFVWSPTGNCSNINIYKSKSVVIQNGECKHVAVTFTSTSVNFFVDGKAVSGEYTQGSHSNIHRGIEPMRLAIYLDKTRQWLAPLKGQLDEVRIWSNARSAADFLANKDKTLVGNEANLVAYYQMEKESVPNRVSNKATSTGTALNGTILSGNQGPYYVTTCGTLGQNNIIQIGPSVLCDNQTTTLKLSSTVVPTNFQWFRNNVPISGADKDSLVVTSPGLYKIEADGPLGTCGKIVREVDIKTQSTQGFLGPDSILCLGDSIWLEIPLSGTFNWQPNQDISSSTGESVKVWPGQNTTYYVQGTTDLGCPFSDSVLIRVIDNKLELQNDTSICESTSLLIGPLDTFQSYSWRSGQTTAQISVSTADLYHLEVVSNDGCVLSDSVRVTVDELPRVSLTGDTTVCSEDVNFLLANRSRCLTCTYRWDDGLTAAFRSITTPGTYKLVATNNCGADSASVTVSAIHCACEVYIPNAFTPNNDNMNETFGPEFCPFTEYELIVFNRWGEKIFVSDSVDIRWDGSYQNKPVQMGAYMWILRYKMKSRYETQHMMSGTVHVLK